MTNPFMAAVLTGVVAENQTRARLLRHVSRGHDRLAGQASPGQSTAASAAAEIFVAATLLAHARASEFDLQALSETRLTACLLRTSPLAFELSLRLYLGILLDVAAILHPAVTLERLSVQAGTRLGCLDEPGTLVLLYAAHQLNEALEFGSTTRVLRAAVRLCRCLQPSTA
ncbi:hypothetical protein [Methylobacterium iners]|nr:hypothetical protein [Methylobacterium iners]